MPWKETDVMNLRTEFVLRALRGVEPFGELCREYEISRKTGYKWKERFLEQGLDGLADRPRKPRSSPSQADEETVCRIVQLKMSHSSWGPKKIRALYGRSYPDAELPSESSFKRILGKAGLVQHRRRRRPEEQGGRVENRILAEEPNQVWTVDFKGWWYTLDRRRFEPLTIRDDFSRYLLCAQALENSKTATVREQFSRVFRKYGLPRVIRSDNGSPFAASQSPLGLSRLSAWWLALGIDLDRIKPGRPDQNGGHERMHRDIAIEVESEAEVNVIQQQATLDVWRQTFNEERPHEAIGMQVPSDLYQPSARRFDPSAMELEYPASHLRRKVGSGGTIKLQGICIGISTALAGWDIGLEPETSCCYSVWFCRLCLGELDLRTRKFQATRSK